MISVKDKVVVVTGSNGLLGKSICKTLKEDGARVVEADINLKDNQDLDQYFLDITDALSIQNLIQKIVSRHDRIDGWLNNAYPRTQDWGQTDFATESMESWRKNVDMHMNGYVSACQQVLNQMKKQGFGSLVNMSSIYGSVGPDFSIYEGTEIKNPAAYAAIKGGIVNLSRYLCAYYGPSGLRINCISPGGIFNQQSDQFVKAYEQRVPLRRMGKADDIAQAVLYLMSDASSYVSGIDLKVDGGWTAI